MADNDLRDDEEREDDEEGEGKSAQNVKFYKKWWFWLALAIALIAVAVTVTLLVLNSMGGGDAAAEGEQASEAREEVEAKPSAIYYPLKPEFVTNFNVRGRQRFMKVDITLMLRDNAVVPALELHMPALRNALVMLMRGQVYEELQTPEGKELLRQHALTAVQEVLEAEIGKPGVEQVLFTNFVMQ